MFAYLLEKLRDTPDGEGTLLDHSLVLYGSGMSNSNQHDHEPLPIVFAGVGRRTERRAAHPRRPKERRCRTCCSRCSTSSTCRRSRSATAPGRSRSEPVMRASSSVLCLGLMTVSCIAVAADGTRAIHRAVRVDDVATVSKLVAARADVTTPNEYGVTPLQLAIENSECRGNPGAARCRRIAERGRRRGRDGADDGRRSGSADAVKRCSTRRVRRCARSRVPADGTDGRRARGDADDREAAHRSARPT